MMQEALKYFPYTYLTCIGLVLFFAVFVGALLWVFRKESKSIYQDMSHLPLRGDN